jgi:hypothetical protein
MFFLDIDICSKAKYCEINKEKMSLQNEIPKTQLAAGFHYVVKNC